MNTTQNDHLIFPINLIWLFSSSCFFHYGICSANFVVWTFAFCSANIWSFFLLTLGFCSIRKLFLSDKPLKQSSFGHLQINASAGIPCSNSLILLLFSLLPTVFSDKSVFCLFSILVFSTNKFFFFVLSARPTRAEILLFFFQRIFPFIITKKLQKSTLGTLCYDNTDSYHCRPLAKVKCVKTWLDSDIDVPNCSLEQCFKLFIDLLESCGDQFARRFIEMRAERDVEAKTNE